MHLSMIRVSDLVLVNDSGQVLLGGAQHPINSPAFAIHREFHRAQGIAFSCFGRPIETLYQDALRFHNDLAVYNRYGGTVISVEEGARITKALGPTCRNMILQDFGMKTCGQMLLANGASGSGWEKVYIGSEKAEVMHRKSGNPSKMWLAIQPYIYQVVLKDLSVLESGCMCCSHGREMIG
ncbi:aldolase [Penicillium lividum]|nr:aldolase [Penicillium lividum]